MYKRQAETSGNSGGAALGDREHGVDDPLAGDQGNVGGLPSGDGPGISDGPFLTEGELMDAAPAILQYCDCVVKPVKPIRLYFDDLSLHTGRHHAFMGDNGSLRQGGVNLPGGQPVPGLTGQSDIPFLLIVQKLSLIHI